jgi:hypothetical protein
MMKTQGAILEGLREKRAAVTTGKNPRVDVKVISESQRYAFVKCKECKIAVYSKGCYTQLLESIVNSDDKPITTKVPKDKSPVPSIVLMVNAKYVGDAYKGIPHGHGTIASHDGCLYDGEWKDGHEHGKGTFIDNENNLYDGLWHNGVRHGKGTFLIGDDKIDVEYVNGELVKIAGCVCEETKNTKTGKWVASNSTQ